MLHDFRRLAGLSDPRTLVTEADAWTVRQKRLSVSKDLTPKDVEDLVASVSGQDLKAALKKARQLGRDFQRTWRPSDGRDAGPNDDGSFKTLMAPFDAARAQLKHPDDDLSHEAVRKFEASLKAEGKLRSAWNSGFTEVEKLYLAARRERELEVMHSAPPGVFSKHDKNNGYGGIPGVERALAAATDPAVRDQLQKMIALMKAPLDY
jgi:hypothetical protein